LALLFHCTSFAYSQDDALTDPIVQEALHLTDSVETTMTTSMLKLRNGSRTMKMKGRTGPLTLIRKTRIYRGGLAKEVVRVRSSYQRPIKKRLKLVKWNGHIIYVRQTKTLDGMVQRTHRSFDVNGKRTYPH
jgi:hypothetical protein